MVDTKNPGDKTLSVSPTKTLTLKPRVEQGTVRQSFSHGRTKQVVVEKRGKRRIGGDAPAEPAAKAGQVVSGFTKVETALGQHQAVALLHASDGADDGIRKLNARMAAASREFPGDDTQNSPIPVITALSSDELDLALGRSNVIHAAVLAGPAGRTFLSRSQILVRYRMAIEGGTDGKPARISLTKTAPQRATQQD